VVPDVLYGFERRSVREVSLNLAGVDGIERAVMGMQEVSEP
jgi:hypothetical protein